MANQYLPGVIATPSSLLITDITRSNPMVITVEIGNSSTESNTYIAGMAVKLFVPISYKMFQADGLIGTITNISGSDFTLNINSSSFDAFVIPSSGETPASISPAGSRNLQYDNNNILSVPFKSLNNQGN